jgi:hypothetical protein
VENEDNPNEITGAVQDRRRTVLDCNLTLVARYQGRVISQGYNAPLTHHPADDVLRGLACLFIYDTENILNGLTHCFLELPSGQIGCDGIQKADPAFSVSGQYRVTDTGERNAEPFALVAEARLTGQ